MLELASRTVFGPAALVTRWFGAGDRNVVMRTLKRMEAVLLEPNRGIRFVNKTAPGVVLRVTYNSIYSSKLHDVGQPGTPLNPGTFAYVFPTDRRNERGDGTRPVTHTGSGMRVFICGEYMTAPADERATTIYHELTHKIIGTEDYVYGEAGCLALPDDQKIWTADNYAWNVMEHA
jgi:hypothetical protein